MPCFQIRVREIEFQAKSIDALADALRQQGFNVTKSSDSLSFARHSGEFGYQSGTFYNGKLSIVNGSIDMAALKKGYAASLVKSQWSKHGTVTQTATNKFVVRLRS